MGFINWTWKPFLVHDNLRKIDISSYKIWLKSTVNLSEPGHFKFRLFVLTQARFFVVVVVVIDLLQIYFILV